MMREMDSPTGTCNCNNVKLLVRGCCIDVPVGGPFSLSDLNASTGGCDASDYYFCAVVSSRARRAKRIIHLCFSRKSSRVLLLNPKSSVGRSWSVGSTTIIIKQRIYLVREGGWARGAA